MGNEELREDGFLTLPRGWKVTTLDEVAKEGGLVDGDWIESADMDEDGEVQLVQLGHIGQGQFKGEPNRFITDEFAKKENCTVLSEGDLLISRMQEPILRSCLLPSFDRDSVMAVDIARLQETDDWNRQFLKYVLNSRPIWKQGIAWASGTTRKRISRKNMEKLRLPTPSLSEQRKIATVLYTVDRAIEKTEEILQQKETTKRGVLHQLLQTGIGENEITETKLGPKSIKFPINWEVTTLGDVSTKMRNGFVGTATPYYSDEEDAIPYLQSFNVRENRVDNRDKMESVEPDFHKDNPKTQLSQGDLLTVQSGHIGTSCVVPAEYDGANCHALIITRFEENKVNPNFVSQFLNSKIGSDLIKSITVGTTVEHLNLKEFENMRLPLPPLSEQNKIVETMSDFDRGIENEKQYSERLKRLKHSLIQDLLSGTVRTTDTNIEVPDEIAQYG
jgi:type I restriction enzyme S subunit